MSWNFWHAGQLNLIPLLIMQRFILTVSLSLAFVTLFQSDVLADALVEPAVGEPVPTGIGLATYCQGDPETAKWKVWQESRSGKERTDRSNSCYLPWLGSTVPILPDSTALGYVDMNITGMWCGKEPSAVERMVVETPKFLFVKIPRAPRKIAKRGVMISIRVMIGGDNSASNEGRDDTHWGEWRRMREEKLGDGQKVIAIPFDQLAVQGTTRFQVLIYLLDGNSTYAERLVDFVSSVNC